MDQNTENITKYRRKGSYLLAQREVFERIMELYAEGHTDASVARMMDLSTSTITKWNKKPFFKRKKEIAKLAANGLVTNAVFRKAMGLVKVRETKETLTQHGEIVELTTTKELPPDTAAAKLWLENKDSENWKAQQSQLNQVLVNVSTNDLLLTLQSASSQIGIVDRGGGGVSPVVDGGVAGSLTSNNHLNPITSQGLNPAMSTLNNGLMLDIIDSRDTLPIDTGLPEDSKYSVIAKAKEALEGGPVMSEEDALKELVSEGWEESES